MTATIGDVEKVLGEIAPLGHAESWDNVGLLAGDRTDACRKVLLCIDLSDRVLDEAERLGANLLLCYHPPLFKPIARLRADRCGTEALLWRTARMGCAIYSPHTALDAAPGGTNDVMADLCRLVDARPLDDGLAGPAQCKVVVFVPTANVDAVAEAMFHAGAGQIGQYHHCSFRIPGQGTFWPGEGTHPVVGQPGRLERVDELRLEVICPISMVPEVVAAIRESHPYEEPAFDVQALLATPAASGMGRIGRLAAPVSAMAFAQQLSRAVGTELAMLAGDGSRVVKQVAVVVGSAGTWALQQRRFAEADLLVTGELKHHDAIAYVAAGKVVLALGHWASERPALEHLAGRVGEKMPALEFVVSQEDRDIWTAVR